MKLDIKGWQKIRGSDTHSIMRNEEGHQLKIAHNALSEAHRKALMDLPISESKPAKASGEARAEEQAPKAAAAPVKSNAPSNKPDVKKLDADAWQGRDAKMYEEGGPVQPAKKKPRAPGDDVPEGDASRVGGDVTGRSPVGNPTISDAWKNIKAGLGYADGGPVSSMQDSPEQITQDAAQTPVEDQMQNAVQQAPADQSFFGGMQQRADDRRLATEAAAPEMAPQQGMPAQQAPAPQGAMPSQPKGQGDPFGTAYQSSIDEQMKGQEHGFQQQQKGFEAEATAQQAGAAAAKAGADKANQDLADLTAKHAKEYADIDKERKGLQSDIDNFHVDPNRYIHSKSTGSKIMTAIGLIIGGMGAGLTHTENPVDKYLQQMVSNDMEAQKLEMGKKENLLSSNMRRFGNLRDATDMTRINILDSMRNTMSKAAAVQQGAAAKGALMERSGVLERESSMLHGQMALRRTLMSGAADGQIPPERMIQANPYGAPEEQQKAAMSQLKEAQAATSAKQNALAAFDQVAKVNTAGNRVLSPIQSGRQVHALQEPTVAMLSKELAGKFTEQDAKALSMQWPQVGDDKNTAALKRQRFERIISEKMHYPALDLFGIKQYSVKPQGPAAIGPPKFNQR